MLKTNFMLKVIISKVTWTNSKLPPSKYSLISGRHSFLDPSVLYIVQMLPWVPRLVLCVFGENKVVLVEQVMSESHSLSHIRYVIEYKCIRWNIKERKGCLSTALSSKQVAYGGPTVQPFIHQNSDSSILTCSNVSQNNVYECVQGVHWETYIVWTSVSVSVRKIHKNKNKWMWWSSTFICLKSYIW